MAPERPESPLERARAAAEQAVELLTRRQQEVAGLVAQGLTNAEIARRLVLTPGTVASHMEHILRRLNLRSRSQVAVWAVEQGLRPVQPSCPALGQTEWHLTRGAEWDTSRQT